MNDLPYGFHSQANPIIYADDTSVLLSADSEAELQSNMNLAIDFMTKWFSANSLVLNMDKTNIVKFTSNKRQTNNFRIIYHDKLISGVNTIKLLVLHIDKDLNWKTHIQNLLPKLSSACYLIRRMYPLFNMRTLKMIYYTYFHSVMEFGMFWGASAESRKVFLLQKRILQVMTGSPPRATCRTLFCKLGILTMVAQYVLSLMKFLASNPELFTFNTSVHGINTRTSSKLDKPSVRLKLNQQGPYNSCVNIYNKLPNGLAILITKKKLSLKQLRVYISTKPIYSLDEQFES